MKKFYTIFIPVSLSFIFQCCDTYESKVPIDRPVRPINRELLGTWENPRDQRIITVAAKGDSLYRIDVEPGKKKDRDQPVFLAYETDILGSTFLNVVKEGADSTNSKYALYKFRYHSGMLQFYKLSPFIREQFSSSADLKTFIAFNMKNNYFFAKDSVLLVNRALIEKKEKEAEIYKREQILKDFEEERNVLKKRLLIVTMAFVISALLVLLFYFTRKFKMDKILSEAKIENLLRQQQLQSVSDMLDAQENERVRIAGDLHDRLGSVLSTIKLYFSSMEAQLENTKTLNKEYYSKTVDLIDHACEEVRRISHNLVSGTLIQFGLESALKELSETIERTGRLRIVTSFKGMKERVDGGLEVSIFRVIQELLNNVIKHAQAKNVVLNFEKKTTELLILIADDGIGFNPHDYQQGLGLKNALDRIAKAGGTLNITGTPGGGTTINISVPI